MTQSDIEHQAQFYDQFIDRANKVSVEYFRTANQNKAMMEHYMQLGDVDKVAEYLRRMNLNMKWYNESVNDAAKLLAAKYNYYQNAESYYFTPHKVYKGSIPRGRNY